MSERFRSCRRCAGTGVVQEKIGRDGITGETHRMTRDCPTCDGSGSSGDAMDYVQNELAKCPMEQASHREAQSWLR